MNAPGRRVGTADVEVPDVMRAAVLFGPNELAHGVQARAKPSAQ
jgi:hypothetical protein